MKKYARMLSLLSCVTALFLFSIAGATPAHAATAQPATIQGNGGCSSGLTVQVCILENPAPAIFADATLIIPIIPSTTCRITVTILEPGLNGDLADSGPVDCTKTSPSASVPAVPGQTYAACVSGTVNGGSVGGCTPFQKG